mmetsp:Transcript_394/g.1334  ORF Transcript_394/g.1334 Transcript_394/m.1334 type:complete len:217 (-) Transcript_394:2340-2990(-)
MKSSLAAVLIFATMSSMALAAAAVQDEQISQRTWFDRRYRRQMRGYLEFEISEDTGKFAFDEAPVDKSGLPTYGNPFITRGFIYPKGTLSKGKNGKYNGVVDGKPEFPDKVIGVWICQGHVFGDNLNIKTGPLVSTIQQYDFVKQTKGVYGQKMFTSTGLELVDVGKVIRRSVTGGTGPYRYATGQIEQTFLGLNGGDGVVVQFRVKRSHLFGRRP